jgi:hypothetical protein
MAKKKTSARKKTTTGSTSRAAAASAEARREASAATAVLPGRFRSKTMTGVLLKSLYDGEFRERFRADPRPVLKKAGIDLPARLKIDVHENDETTLHVILPGYALDRIPRKSARMAKLPLALFEALKGGSREISDDDLRSAFGSPDTVGILNDDVLDGGKRGQKDGDPTVADTKGDGRTGGDTYDFFTNADNDPRPADGSDTADGTDKRRDTGRD